MEILWHWKQATSTNIIANLPQENISSAALKLTFYAAKTYHLLHLLHWHVIKILICRPCRYWRKLARSWMIKWWTTKRCWSNPKRGTRPWKLRGDCPTFLDCNPGIYFFSFMCGTFSFLCLVIGSPYIQITLKPRCNEVVSLATSSRQFCYTRSWNLAVVTLSIWTPNCTPNCMVRITDKIWLCIYRVAIKTLLWCPICQINNSSWQLQS